MLATVGFRDIAASASSRIVCPLCTYDQNQIGSWVVIDAEPDEASPAKASVQALQFEGGCGCLWELRFKILPGKVDSYIHILRPCINRAGLQQPADPEAAARALDGHEL
jgi:hypothetical protein